MKNMNKDIRFILVFIFIVSFSFIYLFQTSLAKYRKQVTGNVDLQIAKWNIKINDEDVANKSVLTNNIVPVFEGNEYTNDSVIAPGSKGYCDIIIDATNVDVDFTYELNISIGEENKITDLRTTGYILNPTDSSTETDITSNQAITGEITHNTSETKIRLYFEWYDEEDNNMDNTADTEVGIDETSKAVISANIRFSQKKSA
jgi:hypothetical protein